MTKILFLLAAACLSLSMPATAGEAGTGGTPHVLQRSTHVMETREDCCCQPALEGAITPPTTKETCSGTRWTPAWQGECRKQEKKRCLSGAQTLVTVHEYSLAWVGGKCLLAPTGNSGTVQVAECGGNTCL